MWHDIFIRLQQNKLRTALTGLSVSVGIFLLIVLLGAGNGLIHAFNHNNQMFSTDAISSTLDVHLNPSKVGKKTATLNLTT